MDELDPRQRFTATVDAYARWRPTYPASALDHVIARAALAPGDAVVDLGTGTGIVARALAARGFRVTGVDPNEAMLQSARASSGGVTYVVGESTATGLPSASAALVIAAQAFHWFPLPRTLDELARVLVPGGWVAAMWNVRAHTPFMRAYEALLDGVAVFRTTPQPGPTMAALEATPGLVDMTRWTTDHQQRLDREGLHGRASSSSYVAHASPEDRSSIRLGLDRLFDAHATAGEVEFSYDTTVLSFRLAARSAT